MSDSVAKSEIEDVLSSIRRLVSEHGRKVPLKAPEADEAKPGRLVLTPALRVDETTNDVKAPVSQAESTDSRIDHMQPSGVQVTGIDGGAETARPAEHGNGAPIVLSASYSEDQSVASEKKGEEANSQSHQEEDRNGNPKIGPLQEELADSLSAKIEALETAIAQTDDQWEPDGESDDAYSGTRIRRITLRLSDEPAETQTAEIEADRDEVEQIEAARATETQDEQHAEELRTDDAPRFVHATTDRSERDVAQEDQEDPSSDDEAAPDPDRSDLNLGEGLFDEEALRLMVADIVREELQGALGERITRNVRKLVRREIQIALAARDLK